MRPGAAPDEPEHPSLATVCEAYVQALLVPDARQAWAVVEAAVQDGAPAAQLYLHVLAPAMVQVGTLWETASISVAQEHLATQITQSVLARLAPRLGQEPAAAPARTALIAGTPGELHAVGARMVADFLESAGWDALLLGPDTPADELIALARERRPHVVALSTALSANLLAAARTFAALGRLEPRPLLVAGGRAYDGDPDRARIAGADVFAADPAALLRELAVRLP